MHRTHNDDIFACFGWIVFEKKQFMTIGWNRRNFKWIKLGGIWSNNRKVWYLNCISTSKVKDFLTSCHFKITSPSMPTFTSLTNNEQNREGMWTQWGTVCDVCPHLFVRPSHLWSTSVVLLLLSACSSRALWAVAGRYRKEYSRASVSKASSRGRQQSDAVKGSSHRACMNVVLCILGKEILCAWFEESSFNVTKGKKKSKVVKTLSSLSKKHKIKIFLGQFLQNCCTWEFNKNPNLPQKASSSYLENNFRTTCILMLPVLSSSAPSTLWWHHLWFIQNIVSYAPLSVRALSGTGGNPPLSSMTCCATTTWKSTAETQQHIWVYLWHTVFWQIQRGLSYEICYVTVPNHFTVKSHLAAVRDYSMEEQGWNSPVLQHIVLTGITSCVSFELSGKVIETESLIWSLFIFEAQIIWLLVL